MLKKRDSGPFQTSARHRYIAPAAGLEHKYLRQIARIPADQEGSAPIPIRYPRAQNIGIVGDVVEREAIALDRATHNRQEIDQIFATIGDWSRVFVLGNSALPPRERRLHDPFVDLVMVASADSQSQPMLQLGQG